MISLFGKNEPEPTLLEKLKASVSKTKAVLSETVDTIFQGEKKIDASLEALVMTGHGTIDTAVRAMQALTRNSTPEVTALQDWLA